MFRNAWPRYVLGLSNPLLTTTFYQKFIMTLSFVKLVFILADQSIKSPMRICVLGASMQEKIKQKLQLLWYYICWPYNWIVLEIKYRKKLKKLRKEDPFIYD